MGIQSNLRDHLLSQPPSFKKKKDYTLLETIGQGGFGKVVRAKWAGEGGGKEVALKIIPKKLVKHDLNVVMDEVNVLKSLDHPNIVHVWDHFESRDKYYITFELAIGGELFDRITSRGRFTEKDAVECIRQVLEATVYLHSREIVHRDLKPENVLYKTNSHHSPIVIADFGIAKHLEYDPPIENSSPTSGDGHGDKDREEESPGGPTPTEEKEKREGGVDSFAGSFGYAAPEVLAGLRHGLKVDCWSIGVIAYTLLCGYSPFRSDDKMELIKETQRGKITFHERYWRKVSGTAKDFIRGMLVVDPKARMSAQEALDHPWMTNGQATTHDLSTTSNLKNPEFNAKLKFQAAVHAVNASNRIRSLAPSRSGSTDTTSIPSPSSPTSPTSPSVPAAPPTQFSTSGPIQQGQGSRKSSLSNTNPSTLPSTMEQRYGDESEEDGYVTAEDEDEEGDARGQIRGRTVNSTNESPNTDIKPPSSTPSSAPNSRPSTSGTSTSTYGLKGIMGRMKL